MKRILLLFILMALIGRLLGQQTKPAFILTYSGTASFNDFTYTEDYVLQGSDDTPISGVRFSNIIIGIYQSDNVVYNTLQVYDDPDIKIDNGVIIESKNFLNNPT